MKLANYIQHKDTHTLSEQRTKRRSQVYECELSGAARFSNHGCKRDHSLRRMSVVFSNQLVLHLIQVIDNH